jgi:hypothetical protein
MKPEPNLILKALRLLDAQELEAKRHRDEKKWKEFDGIFTEELKIENKYKGYVASFGGTVVQMGIMPACMAFWVDDNKKKVVELMLSIYWEVYLPDSDPKGLESYLNDNWARWDESNRKSFRMKFTKAAVSLKMAMRTFEFDKGNLSD